MEDLKIESYSEWRTENLENELKFLYIEIGRLQGREASDNINKIRQIEAELVSRKIKGIAKVEDIKRANANLMELVVTKNTTRLLNINDRYRRLLEEFQSIFTNKKEVNGLSGFETGILSSIKEMLDSTHKEPSKISEIISSADFQDELKEAILAGVYTDYVYNGEEEEEVERFNGDFAKEKVTEILNKYFIDN